MVMLLHMSFDPHSHVMSHYYVIVIVGENAIWLGFVLFREWL
ncbi:MAG: hypothetical protein AAFX96_01875 [Pseudomonadota bacterium]